MSFFLVKFIYFYLFQNFFSPIVPTHVVGVVVLAIFMVTLYVQGRQTEWTSRLDFLWKTQVCQPKHGDMI